MQPQLGFADLSSQRKRFTVDEVYRMMDAGIIEGRRFELIDGDLIHKMAHNPPHAFCVGAVQKLLIGAVGFDRVRAQLPIRMEGVDQDFNEPQPDLAVVAETAEQDFSRRHPKSSEISLIVEVSDSTLRGDLNAKRDLYARFSVPEYWVLDLAGRRLIVHRNLADGHYKETVTLMHGLGVEFEGTQLPVAQMLPSA